MRNLTFNRLHKNGWFSYKINGVAGAVFIDGRMLTDAAKASMPSTLDVDLDGFVEAGANATEAQREKEEKKAARDASKAERAMAAAAKASSKLEKLQAAAAKAQERADAVAAKVAGAGAEVSA